MNNKELIKQQLEEGKVLIDKFLEDNENISKIEKVAKIIGSAVKKTNKVLVCGNGGSMCDAMHFAEEMTGRYREDRKALPAIAISDSSHITCVGNDYGFNTIFSRSVEALGNKNDVLFAITTSGESENILKAIEKAKMKELKVVALTGKSGLSSDILDHVDVEIKISHEGYSDRIQEMHIKIIHILVGLIESEVE